MSSSELEIAMADPWEVLQHASVDIIGPLNTAQTTSGSAKMAAVQELYLITVSIANIFINTQSKKLTLFTEGMAYHHTEGDEHFEFKGEHVHSSDESTHQILSYGLLFLTFYHFPYTAGPPTSTVPTRPSLTFA